MYITQEIAKRIRNTAKSQNVKTGAMLSECGLGINALSEFDKGKHISSISLATLADYLNCSVDYLLGRSDNPQSHKCPIALGDISNNNGVIGGIANSAPVTINNGEIQLSQNAAAMLEIFNTLDTVNQAELLVHANKLKNGKGA